MNCTNCGAPLAWTPGAEVLHCGHCGSYRSLTACAASADGLAWLDEAGTRHCPVCHEALGRAVLQSCPVEACPQCRGILLDDVVFAEVVRQRRAEFRGAEPRPRPLDRAALRRQVWCPGCRSPMEVHPYYGPGNQVVDSCSRCGLIWLDHGELAAIEQAPGLR